MQFARMEKTHAIENQSHYQYSIAWQGLIQGYKGFCYFTPSPLLDKGICANLCLVSRSDIGKSGH